MTKANSEKTAKEKTTKARDNFLQPVKTLLREMCGGICSNPDCRVYTFGANQEGTGGFSNIGVAAHITAAAAGPGARRYDPLMEEEARKSANNGIWLCQSCSKLIDTDEIRFTVRLLHEWKFQAEKRAMELIGKTSIAPAEHQSKLVEAVASAAQLAYTGIGDYTKIPLAGFVAGYDKYLSQLDPRFEVRTTATGNHLTHEIRAKPGQHAKIDIVFKDPATAQLANAGWKNFLDNGESFEIKTSGFEFVGSALFELLNNKEHEGVFSLEPHKTAVPCTMYFKSLTQNLEFEIASFDSYLHTGGENLFIFGQCLNGLLDFKYKYNSKSLQVKIDYNFNPEKWIDSLFSNLEHLPKLMKAVSFLRRDVESRMVIEFNLNGTLLSFGESTDHDLLPFYEYFCHVTDTIDRAKTIALAVDKDLTVKNIDITEHNERLIKIYSEILRGHLTTNEPAGKDMCTAHLLNVTDEAIQAMNKNGLSSYIRMRERCGEDFDLMGNTITPPVFQSELHGFEAALFTDLDSVKDGELGLKIYAIEGTTITHSIEKKAFTVA